MYVQIQISSQQLSCDDWVVYVSVSMRKYVCIKSACERLVRVYNFNIFLIQWLRKNASRKYFFLPKVILFYIIKKNTK